MFEFEEGLDYVLSQDVDADPFSRPAPPPDGIHLARLDFFVPDDQEHPFIVRDSNGQKILVMSVVATILAPGTEYDGAKVFDRLSSYVGQSGISRLAGLVKLLGGQIRPRMTLRELAEEAQRLIAGQPLVRIETRWVARAEVDGEWKTVRSGMKRFPMIVSENGTVKYRHVFEDPEIGKVEAQAKIVRYLPAD